jgi:predicted permease
MIQLVQTIRRLLRAPGFTLTTVLTLAIGIGATTAIFSVVNGILIKPLPFPESDRLIALRHQTPSDGSFNQAASPALYFTYRENSETLESVALWFPNTASVTGAGDPEEVRRLQVTHEFLPTLDVEPSLGRGFTEADDQPGSAGTVMLSYAYWQRRFGSDADVIGRTLVVDGAPREVIGVLPQGFRFLQQTADILMPAQPNRQFALVPSIGERGIARLKDGVTLEEALADAERQMPILFESFPLVPGFTRERLERSQFGPNFRFLKEDIVGDLDDVLWLLMGTIGMLLLVACANVANLQLVRTEARDQELAIRIALGAGWTRIARSLLLESMTLGLAGGALGLLLAAAGLPVLLSAAAQDLPSVFEIRIDVKVLLFALLVALASGLVFGSIPVLKYAGARVSGTLGATGRTFSASRERHRVRNTLVVAQVAVALVLLVASGLMIRTFQSLRDVDAGFTEPEEIQTLTLSIPQATAPDFARVIQMLEDIQNGLAVVAGIESVGFSTFLPLPQAGPNGPYFVQTKPDTTPLSYEFRYTSPDFFRTLGTPLVAGRDFRWEDYYDASRQLVIVSENLATQEWGSPTAALGKRVRRGPNAPWLEVVGVAGDLRYDGLTQPAPLTIYHTLTEQFAQFSGRRMSFAIRSPERVGTAGFIDDLQAAIWSVNPELPLAGVQTMGDLYERETARTSLTLVLLAITGGMALLLGLVGIYGVVHYMLTHRTREIGIRKALGAIDTHLRRMLVGHVVVLVAIGVAFGLGAAAALSRLIESQLYGVTSLDFVTYASVAALLFAAALLAAHVAARRVTEIDPMQALREQ